MTHNISNFAVFENRLLNPRKQQDCSLPNESNPKRSGFTDPMLYIQRSKDLSFDDSHACVAAWKLETTTKNGSRDDRHGINKTELLKSAHDPYVCVCVCIVGLHYSLQELLPENYIVSRSLPTQKRTHIDDIFTIQPCTKPKAQRWNKC